MHGVLDDMGDVSVGYGVVRLPAYPLDRDQSGGAERAQVLRDKRLCKTGALSQTTHRGHLLGKGAQQAKARGGRKDLEQFGGGFEILSHVLI